MDPEDRMVLSDHELLIRIDTRLEGVIEDKKDHENRIRELERSKGLLEEKVNKAVTPKQLWAGAASAVAVASAAIPFIGSLVNR